MPGAGCRAPHVGRMAARRWPSWSTGSVTTDPERETVLVVDGANVVGARPDGWWRDRAGAAARLHGRLATASSRSTGSSSCSRARPDRACRRGPSGSSRPCTPRVPATAGRRPGRPCHSPGTLRSSSSPPTGACGPRRRARCPRRRSGLARRALTASPPPPSGPDAGRHEEIDQRLSQVRVAVVVASSAGSAPLPTPPPHVPRGGTMILMPSRARARSALAVAVAGVLVAGAHRDASGRRRGHDGRPGRPAAVLRRAEPRAHARRGDATRVDGPGRRLHDGQGAPHRHPRGGRRARRHPEQVGGRHGAPTWESWSPRRSTTATSRGPRDPARRHSPSSASGSPAR